jgi:hypothetical protein
VFFPVDLWFRAFLVTVAVEVPIVAFGLRRFEPSWPRLLVLILFANLASHPAVWFIFTQLLLIGTAEYLLVAEGWAVAAEALFYWAVFRGLPARRSVLVSFVANMASFLLAELLARAWPELFQ